MDQGGGTEPPLWVQCLVSKGMQAIALKFITSIHIQNDTFTYNISNPC